MGPSLWFALVSAFAGMTWASPERVVADRASRDLACPVSELEVSANHGGAVFHSALVIHGEARGCGRVAQYRCEAPLRRVAGIDVLYPTVCE